MGAVGWMRSGGSRRRPRKRISTIRDKRKKAREEGRRPKLLPLLLARQQTPRAILPLLTRCSNKVIPIENANYMVIIFALLSKSLISTSSPSPSRPPRPELFVLSATFKTDMETASEPKCKTASLFQVHLCLPGGQIPDRPPRPTSSRPEGLSTPLSQENPPKAQWVRLIEIYPLRNRIFHE